MVACLTASTRCYWRCRLPISWRQRFILHKELPASRTVSIAGSTGSIGTQALEVLRANPGRFEVIALGARSSVELLGRQARELHPKKVAIADAARAGDLAPLVPP